jgi:hypothetical protein
MVAGGLALGASALASSDDPEPAPAVPPAAKKWDGRHHHGCRKGEGRRWNRDRDRGSDIEVLGLRY